MSDLTDDQVRALQHIRNAAETEGSWDLSEAANMLEAALLQARALADSLRAETDAFRMCVNCGLVVPASHDRAQPGPGCKAPNACTFDMTPREAWEYWRGKAHQARADAAAAQAAMIERAAEAIRGLWKWDDEGWLVERPDMKQAEDAIRRLAPDAGTAELAKLRERAEKAETQRDALIEAERNAHPAMCAMRRAENAANAKADTLAASLAAQTALVETLTGALEGSANWMDALLTLIEDTDCNPDDEDRWEDVIRAAGMQLASDRAALDAATLSAMTPEERALCERSLATRDAWKKVAEGQG